jgi:hypothetical protein
MVFSDTAMLCELDAINQIRRYSYHLDDHWAQLGMSGRSEKTYFDMIEAVPHQTKSSLEPPPGQSSSSGYQLSVSFRSCPDLLRLDLSLVLERFTSQP